MRTRYNKVNVFLNDDEKNILKRNCEMFHTNQSEYIRSLIIGYDMSKLTLKEEDKTKEKTIDVNQVIKIIDDNIDFLNKVKNRFHYFGYNYDEQEISKEIEKLKLLQETIYK